MSDDAKRAVHTAIGGLLDEGEIAVAWTLTIDVAGAEDVRYLAHRSGGGVDGLDVPMVWAALGMLRAGVQVAEDQLRACTEDLDDDGENDDE